MLISAKVQKRTAINLAVSVTAGCVLIILAPFNTHNFTFLGRVIYWIGLCIAGALGASMFEILMDAAKKTPNAWQQVLGSTLGATLAVSLFIFLPAQAVSLLDILMTTFNIFVVALVISIVGVLVRNRSVPGAQIMTRPGLYDRLSPKLRQGEIYAVRSEDHYVRVFTSKGDEMLLMRLSDAIKETHPLKGAQTHRSWWVAEAGVQSVKRHEGKTILTLKNDEVVPVSRNGQKAIKAEGWL